MTDSDQIRALTEPLLRVSASGAVAPEALLAITLVQVLQGAGPRQAEVLRRCAVPRWFDADVLAALREREDGNDRVLEQLRGYTFVRPVGAGRFAFHDEVREALLAEWQARRPAELQSLRLRLAALLDGRAAAAPPPERAPLEREAIYQLLWAAPEQGMDRLRAAFDRLEAIYLLADAEALLGAARGAPVAATDRPWLVYLGARLDRAALRLDEARAQLERLLEGGGLDPQLGAMARRTLGEVLSEQGQWVRAIELYGQSLAQLEAAGRVREAAEVCLLLGEAFEEVGNAVGGWYRPAYPPGGLPRALARAWHWLLALPFTLLALVLRRTPWSLPQPGSMAFHQNWLLVWIYRGAQRWYLRARDGFAAAGVPAGSLRAEQRLAEILTVFGYPADALEALDGLRARVPPDDVYALAWLDRARAAALLDTGAVSEAEALLDPALSRFRSLGDVRREAAVLSLQARAAALAGNAERALKIYRSSLARYRGIRYTAAREQTLGELRAWRRELGPGPVAEPIGALIADEPEKRYVGRFPRSRLPYLQVLTLAAMPLALLLMAIAAPTQTLQAIAGPLSIETFYNPVSMLGALLVLLLLYLLSYTLVALAVMFFLPFGDLRREQPDSLVMSAAGIDRHGSSGALAQRLGWGAVRCWLRVDRRVWERPMSLFSSSFLEADDGEVLRIDGITGWYSSLAEDIGQHLRKAGSKVRSEQLGFAMLRSRSGALLLLELALLLLITVDHWTHALLRAMPPAIYSALTLVVLGGALILAPLAYWLAASPLAVIRRLRLREDRGYALGVGAAALAMVAIGLALDPGAALGPLAIGLLLFGAYAAADAAYTLLFPGRRVIGAALIVAALALAGAIAAPRASTLYYATLSSSAATAAALTGDDRLALQALGAAQVVVDSPRATDQQRAKAYFDAGRAFYALQQWERAWQAYALAERSYEQAWQGNTSPEILQIRRALAYNSDLAQQRLPGRRSP